MFTRSLIVCFTLACAAGAPLAATAQTIPDEAQKLFDRLTGEWESVTTVGDQSMTDSLTATRTPNKEGIIWYWSGTDIDSGQVATSVGLIGWDGHKGAVVETMISSNGVTFEATWTGKGDRWVSPTRNMEFMDGEYKMGYGERVIEWRSDDEFIISNRNRRLAGKPQKDMKSVFKRKK